MSNLVVYGPQSLIPITRIKCSNLISPSSIILFLMQVLQRRRNDSGCKKNDQERGRDFK